MSSRRFAALSLATVAACVAALAVATPAAADDPTAADLAAALTSEPGIVTGASFVTAPPLGGTATVVTTAAAGFPKEGSSYAVLSTGQASLVGGADSDGIGSTRDGGSVRGDTDRDVTILKVDIAVPSGINCLAGVDFRFLSEEYPQYVGTNYNDAFIFEIDHSTWTTSGSSISAPGDLAFDEFGNIISINAAGASTMTAPLATGTYFGGSTRTLRAQAPIVPGAHSLYFSIFDQGDSILDSAVLLDNLVLSTVANPATDCNPGVTAVAGTVITAEAPVFTDATSTIGIPSQAGVQYSIDDVVQTGEVSGYGTVTVTAAVAGDDALEGPSAWTHTFQTAVTPAVPVAPTLVPGAEGAATLTIPTAAGIQYMVDGSPVDAGDIEVFGQTTVDATALEGYGLDGGASRWFYVWDESATSATPVGPSVDVAEGTYTIPEDTGFEYYVSSEGTVALPGTYPAPAQLTIEAYPLDGGATAVGAVVWTYLFPADTAVTATATAPTFSDPESGDGTVTIPEVEGVSYTINGIAAEAGTTTAAGQVTVLAKAASGYLLEGVTGWSHTYLYSIVRTATAEAPNFTDLPGSDSDTYTIPAVVGVKYYLDGALAPAGTSPVDPGTPHVEISAIAASGYTLAGGIPTIVWTHDFGAGDAQFTVVTAAEIFGNAKVGVLLTVDPGEYAPTPTTTTYQWFRDTAPIAGEVSGTYSAAPADVGHQLQVDVTVQGDGMEPLTTSTSPTATVLPGSFAVASTPTITGTPKVGSTLTAVAGVWNPAASTTFQWFAAGVAITGATGQFFTLTSAQLGKAISVKVTGSRAGYTSQTKTSLQTAAVTAATFTSTPTPTISGTAKVGSTLTASPGTWTPAAAFSYQWYAAGVAISGATASTFVPTSAQAGKAITVKVTGSKTGYTSVAKTSTATAAVALATFTTAPTPTIAGSKYVGATLTATAGTWAPAATLAYQWYASGTAISGATASTFVIKAAQAGKSITVKVTATTAGYVTTSKTSTATGTIFSTVPTPTITGAAKVGTTLKAVPGTWSPAATLTYKWFANGVAISGATGSTFKLTATQTGKKITVQVTGTKSGYATTSKTSAATAVVK